MTTPLRGRPRLARWSILAALSGALLAGCTAVPATPSDSGASSRTASARPSPAALPSAASQPDVYSRVPLPPDLVKFQLMSLGEFTRYDKADQWLYVSWLLQNEKEFEEQGYRASGLADDRPVELGPDSSAADILREVHYVFRMAAASVAGPARRDPRTGLCGQLDTDAVQKIVTTLYDNVGGDVGIDRNQQMASILNTNAGAVCLQDQPANGFYAAVDHVIVKSLRREEQNRNTQTRAIATFIDLKDTDPEAHPQYAGRTYEMQFFVDEYKNFDGTRSYRPVVATIVVRK